MALEDKPKSRFFHKPPWLPIILVKEVKSEVIHQAPTHEVYIVGEAAASKEMGSIRQKQSSGAIPRRSLFFYFISAVWPQNHTSRAAGVSCRPLGVRV